MSAAPRSRPEAVVVGLGSPHRRDDGAGLEAARLLSRVAPGSVQVTALPGRAADLLEAWDGVPLAVVLDAAVTGAPPGTVHRVDGLAETLPAPPPHRSTHDLGLADVLEVGRVLGRLPRRLVILGIEAADVSPGAGLTPAVTRGVRRACRVALEEMGGGSGGPEAGGSCRTARSMDG